MRLNAAAEIAQPALSAPRITSFLRQAGIVLAGSAFVAACAHVSLPLFFTPVPLTLQPFAVLLVGLLLAPRTAAAALAAYLLEGAAGLPVFAPGLSGALGFAHLLGPTGGYLFAYPAAAFSMGWLYRRGHQSFSRAVISAALGNLFILLCGALWLGLVLHVSGRAVLNASVLPFLPGDALKIAAAAAIAAAAGRYRFYHSSARPTA